MTVKYTSDHEWVDLTDPKNAVVGITQHAQDALGDIVFVDLPSPGARFERGDVAGVVESVKAAADIYMPVGGEVVAVNEALRADPSLANTRSPEGRLVLQDQPRRRRRARRTDGPGSLRRAGQERLTPMAHSTPRRRRVDSHPQLDALENHAAFVSRQSASAPRTRTACWRHRRGLARRPDRCGRAAVASGVRGRWRCRRRPGKPRRWPN